MALRYVKMTCLVCFFITNVNSFCFASRKSMRFRAWFPPSFLEGNIVKVQKKRTIFLPFKSQLLRNARWMSKATTHLPDESSLASDLARIITQEKDEHMVLSPNNHRFYMNTRWAEAISGWIKDEKKNQTTALNNIIISKTPHVNFHETLADRISSKYEEDIKTGKYSLVSGKYSLVLPYPPTNTAGDLNLLDTRADANEIRQGNFIKGHYLSLKGITQSPKVLISLYSENEKIPKANTQKESSVKWFLPIEQAFLCPTLLDYRSAVATPKYWSDYSKLAVTVIPKHIHISLRLGLASPKMCPADVFDLSEGELIKYKKDIESRTRDLFDRELQEKTGIFTNPDDLWRVYEKLHGGATQIYIAYAYQESFFDLGKSNDEKEKLKLRVFPLEKALFKKDGLELDPSKYAAKVKDPADNRNSNSKYTWDKNKIERTHFFDVEYDGIKINLHNALKEAGILDEREYNEFERVLKDFKVIL